MRQEDKRSWTE